MQSGRIIERALGQKQAVASQRLTGRSLLQREGDAPVVQVLIIPTPKHSRPLRRCIYSVSAAVDLSAACRPRIS